MENENESRSSLVDVFDIDASNSSSSTKTMITFESFPEHWLFEKRNPPVLDGFPSQKASNEEIWCSLCSYHEQAVEQTLLLQANLGTITLM